jgi:hypothetical protein
VWAAAARDWRSPREPREEEGATAQSSWAPQASLAVAVTCCAAGAQVGKTLLAAPMAAEAPRLGDRAARARVGGFPTLRVDSTCARARAPSMATANPWALRREKGSAPDSRSRGVGAVRMRCSSMVRGPATAGSVGASSASAAGRAPVAGGGKTQGKTRRSGAMPRGHRIPSEIGGAEGEASLGEAEVAAPATGAQRSADRGPRRHRGSTPRRCLPSS